MGQLAHIAAAKEFFYLPSSFKTSSESSSPPETDSNNMKTSMLFTHLSFTEILLITILPFACADLVNDTRKKTPYSEFCVSAFRSDHRSSTTDTPTLGLIMVDKVNANSKSTLTKIEHLLRKSLYPGTKEALTSCKQFYKFVICELDPSSKESLRLRAYKFAVDYMKQAASFASDCEVGFVGKSPLSDSNDYENKAASVASAIASSLL